MRRMISVGVIFSSLVTATVYSLQPDTANLNKSLVSFTKAHSLAYESGTRIMLENVLVDGLPYAMVVDWKNGKMDVDSLSPIVTIRIPAWTGTWAGIPAALTDPLSDSSAIPGTDFSALYLARDPSFIYFRLDVDGPPSAHCTYAVSFNQYLHQVNTPGDLQVETSLNQDGSSWSTAVRGTTGPNTPYTYSSSNDATVAAGSNYVQWQVPIWSLRYLRNTPHPLYQPSPQGLQGIENQFIKVYITGESDSPLPGLSDAGPNDNMDSPMIVDFWPSQFYGTEENPGLSCKHILDLQSSTGDGVYWIDPDGESGAGPIQAFCDMTTDGGGWTYFAHHDQNGSADGLFNTDIGVYRADRADTNSVYSIAGSLNNYISHSEMMVALDQPDPHSAAQQKKILFFNYPVEHQGFSTGPIPCSGLNDEPYSYRIALSGPYTSGGTSNACTAVMWYSRNAGNLAYLTCFYGLNGCYWGSGMGGDNSWNHDGYWYVR